MGTIYYEKVFTNVSYIDVIESLKKMIASTTTVTVPLDVFLDALRRISLLFDLHCRTEYLSYLDTLNYATLFRNGIDVDVLSES